MHFADLLRRSSPHGTTASNSQSPAASASYHGTATATSSSQPRSSGLIRQRSLFGRAARSRPSLETDADLLYPAHHTQPRSTSSRASRYSSTDDHSIGHAPAHSHNLAASSSKKSFAPHSPAPSSLPPSVSSTDVAPSLTTTSPINRYDRLFGPSRTSASVSPRPSSIAVANPLPPSASTSTAPQLSRSASARKASERAPSSTLSRSRSTKPRFPFPPASSSTGTSSTLRDSSTMGTAILRRSSLRRRTGSADSSVLRNETAAPPASTPPVEPSPASAPVVAAIPKSASISAPAPANSTQPGRLARFFGRRKSISSPINVVHKPDLLADFVPVLQDASRTLNIDSPPLAVISAGWQQPEVASKPSQLPFRPSRPVSPRTVAPPKAFDAKPAPTSQPNTVDSESSKVSEFTFPARTSLSNDAPIQLSAAPTSRPRQTKHSTSRSLPLTSLPISNPIPISDSHESVRLSSGVNSNADTSMSLDRPWSLISASEADTPLLKLRKLVVDTEASDESRDGHHGSDGLFFRPLAGATRYVDAAGKAGVHETVADDAGKTHAATQDDADQLRSSSQTTMRSDTKHEAASIPSSNASTVRAARDVAAQPLASGLSAADASDRDVDSVGPLPAKSPSASQHSFRSRQHRRDGSVGSAHSQTTIQQARRSSTASRLTARSSGHWSESRVSEDALSAGEAEVRQARRAEVVALGKGRVKDWVADRPLPMAEAPTLSRSNTLRGRTQKVVAGDDPEVDRKLLQVSEEQVQSSDVEIRDIPDQESQASSPVKQTAPAMEVSQSAISAPPAPQRFARLSAFHDRRGLEGLELVDAPRAAPIVAAAAAPSNQMVEEAIRLGRAPSKRVRRNVSETRSVGEAVMVERDFAGSAQRDGADVGAAAPKLARPLRRSVSLSSKKKPSAVDWINPTLVPALPSAPVFSAAQPGPAAPIDNAVDSDSKKHSKQRSYATSEEAARAKRLELLEREKRLAEKEARRQTRLQQKYALKKQSDPLLAARLALAGLEAREAMPQVKVDSATSAGLQAPAVPERRTSSHPPGRLSVTPSYLMRKDSNAGSVASFHTALDAPVNESAAVPESAGDASFQSKGSNEVRPDTWYSIASSLAVDFEFPVPPQRMKEQLSEDGTLLSRAGLEQSPVGQQWRERRHYAASAQRVGTPPRDSSLRSRESGSKASPHVDSVFAKDYEPNMSASRTMPKLASVSPLDSVKQSAALRRSRSVGYNNRDMRKLSRDQMMQDANTHPSPKSVQLELGQMAQSSPTRGLGIEMVEAPRRYSNASGSATPSTIVGVARHAIAA